MPTVTHVMSDETGQEILAQLEAISQALDSGALTNSQISTVLNDGTPTGSGFLDGGGLKSFFDGLKTKFATVVHNHSGQAITPSSVAATGDVTAVKNGTTYSLGTLGESVSQASQTLFENITLSRFGKSACISVWGVSITDVNVWHDYQTELRPACNVAVTVSGTDIAVYKSGLLRVRRAQTTGTVYGSISFILQ